MSGKDIWTTDEGRQMCRHGDLSHSLNTSCPDRDLCVCKHGEGEHNRTQCWHVLWVDGSHHEICRCTGYRVRHEEPPLVLPTEPTWGIATHHNFLPNAGRWHLEGDEFVDDIGSGTYRAHNVTDFIPLTDEQVARIEQAR